MKQLSLPNETRRLFEVIVHQQTLERAFNEVKKNKGSPGIDKISIKDFEQNKAQELAQLRDELNSWRYEPAPVRQVEIPKPGRPGETRALGIPCVRDRVVQAAIKMVIEPIPDPMFSDNSFGFRPNRNQHQAIENARQYVESGKEFVVDIDLSKFFDRINHDKIIAKLAKVIEDKRVLRLIGMTLRSGVMTKQGFEVTTVGSVQGSPLSPLLSNVILDELDKKLEQRGLSFVRFADDCNIFVKSRKAAERVFENISQFIENKMKLVVNQDKSKVAKSSQVKFLGVTMVKATVAISKIAMRNAKSKIKELTPRGTHLTLEDSLHAFNTWYRGWANYFQVTAYPAQFKTLEARIRRRLRARLISQFKRRKFLFRYLKKHGILHKLAAKTVYSNKGRWALSRSKAIERVLSNEYFEKHGLWIHSNRRLRHWKHVNYWVHLP